jgi:hypothetical protein
MDAIDLELQRTIARERALSARGLDPAAKLLAGARLFDAVRNRMLAGIRSRHPDWPAATIEAEFRRQLTVLRQREERGVFAPVDAP